MAVSLPDPGPQTFISTWRNPISIAFLTALDVAVCAAKGVLLREPLKPQHPEEDQAITLPRESVTETIDSSKKYNLKNLHKIIQ
jgi:hypothetical protein